MKCRFVAAILACLVALPLAGAAETVAAVSPLLQVSEALLTASTGTVGATVTVSATTTVSVTETVKPKTAAGESQQKQVAVQVALPPAQPAPAAAQPIQNLEIQTDGVSAIFINSNVTIEGNTITNSVNAPPAEAPGQPAAGGGRGPGRKPKKKEPKPYAYKKLIEDATQSGGIVTVWEKPEKLYWEIPRSLLGKKLLLQAKLSSGLGVNGVYPGAVLGDVVITLEEDRKKLLLKEINVRLRARDKDSPLHRAVERSFTDSILASLPIAATQPETGAPVVDIRSLLLGDFLKVSQAASAAGGGGFSVDAGGSKIEGFKLFPENIQTRVRYHFKSGGAGVSEVVPDGRSLFLTANIGLRTLPETGYISRQADERVGYFIEAFEDFTSDDPRTRYVRFITAHNVQKASPEAEVSAPKEPLTVWVENTVPNEYRDAVKRGVLFWNQAFDEIGFKDAVVCKMQPDDADWDAEDTRFNVIHWNASRSSSYAGLAQWAGNPLTGEILDFDVMIEGEVIRDVERRRPILDPDSLAELEREPRDVRQCTYGRALANQMSMGITVLQARGVIGDATDVHRMIDEYIVQLVAHEVGHCLGLRHNFKASTLHEHKDLHNRELTDKEGLVSSVMDYAPLNIAPEGVEQGSYSPTTMGPYDKWAIAYGYTPLSATAEADVRTELAVIADRASEPGLIYGTDEDLWFQGTPSGIDPTVEWFDLGREPLDYYESMFETLSSTWPKIPEIIEKDGNYYDSRYAMVRLLGYYSISARKIARYVGGQYMSRAPRVGQSETGLPFKVIPVAVQRRALDLLDRNVFSDERFQFDPQLLNMLLQEKHYHWGLSWNPSGSSEYPIHQVLLNIRTEVLSRLLANTTLARIVDSEAKVSEGEDILTMPEYFERLLQAVWKEVLDEVGAGPYTNSKSFLSSGRRSLQRLFVQRLATIMLTPRGQGQADAKVHAWDTLKRLDKKLEDFLAQLAKSDVALDDYSRVHLHESRETIRRAMEAKFNIRMN